MSLGVTMSMSSSKRLTNGGLAGLFFYLKCALSIADEERKVEEILHGLREIVRVYDKLEDIHRLTVQIVQDAFELCVVRTACQNIARHRSEARKQEFSYLHV